MNYKFIGWCKEGNHDKVWGIICLSEPTPYRNDGKYLTFWGRRGAKLQTKIVDGADWSISKLSDNKMRKGYKEIERNGLDDVYPEFKNDLEKTTIWASLKI